MEGLMFVDGVFPDFSLLKEALLPPYLESAPCSTTGDAENEAIRLLKQSQYQGQPQGAAVELSESGQALDSTLQCRRRSSRGRKKRGPHNSSPSIKVDNWCLPRSNSKKSKKIGHKMSCMMEIPEPSIIYLLEESMKKLPTKESNLEVSKNSYSMNEEHIRTPSVKNGHRVTQSSTMTSNAMELLNLINMKCTRLNKLAGDHLKIEDMDHPWRNGEGGHLKVMKENIPNSDVLSLASSNKSDEVQDSEQGGPIKNKGLLSEDHNSSTSSEVSSVEKDEDQTVECSLLNKSTDYEVCVRKTPRKQRTPTKGVEKLDPSFQGIEFQMHLCFEKEKCDDCQLTVTSFYSRGRSRRKGTKFRLRFKSTSLSSGSEDDQMPAPSSRNKRCASCQTQKTPLWRDAEDGTPLCNACGIRYKKYGMRCGRCWNIPKKDGKSCSRYCRCGGMFRAPV